MAGTAYGYSRSDAAERERSRAPLAFVRRTDDNEYSVVTKTILGVSAALFVLLAIACGGSDSSSSTEKSPYVQENQRLLNALPVMPGAKRLETTSAPYYRDERSDEPLGYTTNAVYSAGDGMMPRDVVEFYALALQERWSYRARQYPISSGGEEIGRVLIAEFTQEDASISVNTDGMYPGGEHTFEVVVDYGGDR